MIIDPFSYARIPAHRREADRIMEASGVRKDEIVEIWSTEGYVAIRRLRVRERVGKVVTFEIDRETEEPSYFLTVLTPLGWVNTDDDAMLPQTLNDPADMVPLVTPGGVEVRKRRHFTFDDAPLDVWRPGYGWVEDG